MHRSSCTSKTIAEIRCALLSVADLTIKPAAGVCRTDLNFIDRSEGFGKVDPMRT